MDDYHSLVVSECSMIRKWSSSSSCSLPITTGFLGERGDWKANEIVASDGAEESEYVIDVWVERIPSSSPTIR